MGHMDFSFDGAGLGAPHPPAPCHGGGGLAEDAGQVAIASLHRCSMAEALELQRQCVAELRDPSSPAALAVLRRQVPVLEALFHRLVNDAAGSGSAGAVEARVRIALQTHQAIERTVALLVALSGPGRPVLGHSASASGGEVVAVGGSAGSARGAGRC